MNLRLLSMLAILTLSPIALSAQTATASPALYAASAAPASFSSSVAPNAFVAAAGTPSAAAAAPSKGSSLPFSGLAVGVKVGLAGYGFDVATPLWPQRLNLRGGASFLTYTPGTIVTDSVNINGTIKFQNAGTMVDWFPFHGIFRLSAGATIYNNTGLTATLNVPAKQSFTFGGTTYYSDPTNVNPITGTGIFTFGGNNVVPRTTIGFGNMLSKKGHLHFETEIGVQYFSAPTVAYTISGTACQNYNSTTNTYTNCGPSSTTVSQASITTEQNNLQNDLTDLRFFPILSFGLSYRIH
ncbi:MAG TPA: hypothetical protein VMQ60_01105 [Acidobacteriaceae bacterium]|jgi:hypothetical protein|nr:hypothetical protein [Acidobacteriaceae bacterium]